ncbi:MAG: GNAT family N-acetyltransferase [Planctomycetaceae bacterium]|jgi:ribosomal protein S18 acetylase RimI-like enzyme|nr:GNAT family N-acetyltransferase [Planctomycetaceae bacterium]
MKNMTGMIRLPESIMMKEIATLSEIEQLVPVIAEIWQEHYMPIIGREQVEYMLAKFQSGDAIQKQIAHDGYHYYAVFHEESIAGYCAVTRTNETAVFLSKFYVSAKYRGLGYGREMLRYLTDTWNQPSGCRIWLTVNKNNTTSIAIYQKLGFRIMEELVTDIGHGFVMDDYKMEKTL